MKYILVTGGGVSGIGKGIVTSSLGALLKSSNLKITAIKIDPYLNIDAGTFSPYEHGEVFVLDDGSEVDLDLGNYERYLDVDLCRLNNITTGQIYQQVTNRERQGTYLGKTVQVIPHITDAIQERVENAANLQKAEICLIELGGTIGDIEVGPFLESMRQLRLRVTSNSFICCHVSLVPRSGELKEHKSKIAQYSVALLRNSGIIPDIIVCRSEAPTEAAFREKISFFSGVKMDRVIDLPDLKSVYCVPIELERQGIIRTISECFNLDIKSPKLDSWSKITEIAINSERRVLIALVGKYTRLADCYTSVVKALEHACYSFGFRPELSYIESERLEVSDAEAWAKLEASDCIIVPGGFGIRGTEGKIKAIEWARKNNKPFLGICFGFQLAVIEFARNVLDIKNAHSAEFDAELKQNGIDYEPIVIEMLDYIDPELKLGGTMRLGLKKTVFVTNNSMLKNKYGNRDFIEERHRHRYEINPTFIERLEAAGLKFVGRNEDRTRMEILELSEDDHCYFVAVQFHPEYKTRPFKPSPCYLGLIEAALKMKP